MDAQRRPDDAAIQMQMQRLRDSSTFDRCPRLFTLLNFLVAETQAGRGEVLKEIVVADRLYSAGAPYDPRIDSTVRVEVRRLRGKLATHYAGAGRHDAVRIDLPVGTYRPVITRQLSAHSAAAPASGQGAIDLAIMPFRALSSDEGQNRFADGLTDELIFALGLRSALRLAPRLQIFPYKHRQYALRDAARELRAAAMLHGTLRHDGACRRITVELADPEGWVTWSARFDGEGDSLHIQERMADLIVSGMPAWALASRA